MTRYAIIEDNPFAVEHLRQMISRLRRDWEMVFPAASVGDTVAKLQSSDAIDLIFMDIELSDGQSFDIFAQTNTVVPIVFTTAYDNHAIQAFKVNGVDYLLKPIDEAELAHALDKYEHIHRSSTSASAPKTTAIVQTDRVLTVSGDKYSYINTSDVSYFISEDHCVIAVIKDGTRRMTNLTNLGELEEALPGRSFFRVSRNIIASITSINRVSKYLKGRLLVRIGMNEQEQEVCVSASRREAFLAWLGR